MGNFGFKGFDGVIFNCKFERFSIEINIKDLGFQRKRNFDVIDRM